jgi:hypothetical protein
MVYNTTPSNVKNYLMKLSSILQNMWDVNYKQCGVRRKVQHSRVGQQIIEIISGE